MKKTIIIIFILAIASGAFVYLNKNGANKSGGITAVKTEDANKNCAYAGKSYKVETISGVPFITSDGYPIRSRMFYGNYPGDRRKMAEADKFKDISVQFESPADASNAHMQMAFEGKIKDIYIKSIELQNLTENKVKALYNTKLKGADSVLTADKQNYKAENSDGMLHIKKSGHKVDGAITFFIKKLSLKKGHKYKLNINIKYGNDRGWFEMSVYNPSVRNFIATTSTHTFVKQQKMAADNEVNFVSLPMPMIWDIKKSEGIKKSYKKTVEALVKTNPNVRIIPRFGVQPPQKWLDENPDSQACYYGGKPIEYIGNSKKPIPTRFVSVSSPKFKEHAGKALAQTIRFLEDNYGQYFAGYHPCAGHAGEWMYPTWCEKQPEGYDKATLSAWRKWLKNKYKTDSSLRTAWNKKDVNIATAPVPSKDERLNIGNIIDPEKKQDVVDFNIFIQEEMADAVLHFGKIIRDTTRENPKLSVFFYGYGFAASSAPYIPAGRGHYALRKVLNSPYVDIVCGPITYDNRLKGGVCAPQSAGESFSKAGKLWLDEDDNYTYITRDTGSISLRVDPGQKTAQDTIEVMRRNIGHEIVRNYGSWWMDLYGTGWFEDASLWKQHSLFKKAEIDMIKNPQVYKPDSALVYDEQSMCYIGLNSAYTTGVLMRGSNIVVGRTGTPWGYYLLDDVLDMENPPKLVSLLCAVALDDEKRAKIKKLSAKSTCIWIWACGYVDASKRKFSLEAAEEASGFKLESAGDVFPKAFPTKEGKAIGLTPFGTDKIKIKPLLSPVCKKGDIILAKYSNGLPAVVCRKEAGKKPQIFCGTAAVPMELYRYAAKMAGVHIYTEQPASVFANGAYAIVSSTTQELHTLDFKTNQKIYDAQTDEYLGTGPVIKLDMKKGDSKFIRIGGGNSQTNR